MDHRRPVRGRQRVYVNVQHIRELEDPTFKEDFRMSKPVFERLVVEFSNHLVETGRLQRVRTGMDLCLMMGLWVIFNQDTYRSTSRYFACDRSVVHYHYKIVIEGLREMAPRYIKWPSNLERHQSAAHFERRFNFAGAFASIDSSVFLVTKPEIEPQRYVRDKKYGVKVQVVSDHRRLVRDLYVGEPASVHDSRVFRRSPLAQNLFSRNDMMFPDQHILGDSAYVNSDKILVPYDDNGHLTPRHRLYNFQHSQTRCSVEMFFALDKGKNRRNMDRLYSRSMTYVIDHIVSGVVLSNFIILEGEDSDGVFYGVEGHNIDVQAAINQHLQAGHDKREYMADMFWDNREEE